MILIALLIVLGLERIAATSNIWQFDYYYMQYQTVLDKATDKDYFSNDNQWKLYVWLLGPSLVLYLILAGLKISLVELVVITAILLIVIGCAQQRGTYRKFLQSSNRGDTESAAICAEQLGQDFDNPNDSLGKALIWINFVHYFGVVFWFVIFSAPGALFFALSHKLHGQLSKDKQQHIAPLLHVLDWLPARITTLGFIFVGNFSKSVPLWLSYLFDAKTPAKHVVTEVAKASEEVEPEENDCTEEPCTMVRLAKRNILFFLTIISILTLYGWLH
jgi:AmpE protein